MTPRTNTTTRRPQSTLATYLAGAAGTGAMLAASQADAAVVAMTLLNGPVINSATIASFPYAGTGPDNFKLTFSFPGQPFYSPSNPQFFFLSASSNFFRIGSSDQYYFEQRNSGQFYHDSANLGDRGAMSFLAPGTVVGGGANGGIPLLGYGNYRLGYGYFADHSSAHSAATRDALTHETDQLNKYIGFRTFGRFYGWMNVSWDAATETLTVNEAFIENVRNVPITIPAAIPEPGTALLALAGIGGAVLRRRRQQAA